MKLRQSSPTAAAVVVAVSVILSATAIPSAAAAAVEHTFEVNMTHLCKEMLFTVVNGQLPGPMIEVTEGDSVTVHVVNKSPYNLTIHCYSGANSYPCNSAVPSVAASIECL